LYIPACPMTEDNVNYLIRQRENFVKGTPSPDFGGGIGESNHVGRIKVGELSQFVGQEGCRAMGLAEWDSGAANLTPGQKVILDRANKILGFYD